MTIVDNLSLTATQKGDAKQIVTAIQQYVEGHINESVEHRNFRQRVQQSEESFDDFLVALRELAKTCQFCSDQCTTKSIRDQIIEDLADGNTIEDLFKEKDLTLDKTITIYGAQEAAKRHWAEITQETQTDPSIRTIGRTRPHQASPQATPAPVCPGSGGSFHQGGRKQCPAYNLTCHTCKRLGHLAKVCRGWKQPLPAQSHPSTMAVQSTPYQDPHNY